MDPTSRPTSAPTSPKLRRGRLSFGQDFRRFFLRGLGTLLPTIITVALIWWVIDFLWNSIGWLLIEAIKHSWVALERQGVVDPVSAGQIGKVWSEDRFYTKFVGVGLALLLIYAVGLLVGNFIGRAFYRAAERLVLSVPFVRALYPAVKQVTDFLLADRENQFEGSRVVAVQPHEKGIWSLALVTGPGLAPLSVATREEMVTVFVPSSPTAFSGYVMLVPRKGVVELPMTVEEAMRLLVSGGVIMPKAAPDARGAATVPVPTPLPPTVSDRRPPRADAGTQGLPGDLPDDVRPGPPAVVPSGRRG